MNLEDKYIDELIFLRSEARMERNWKLSDKIRDYLDSKYVFIFDHENFQEVYHRRNGTRQELILEMKKDREAEKRFEAWLYSTRLSN